MRKQAKFGRIEGFLDDSRKKPSLDIGADHGVISYLLRQRGGQWFSTGYKLIVLARRQ